MKLLVLMAVAGVMTVQGGSPKNDNRVTVYVQNGANVPDNILDRAEFRAFNMFASIGVKIDWRKGKPSTAENALVIVLAVNTPPMERPGALAYASPEEGIHIRAFWDRIMIGFAPTELLTHVMVHEITHILEGISRHSDTGIMKAQWTDDEMQAMKIHSMTFAAEDVDLVHRGLKARAAARGLRFASVARE